MTEADDVEALMTIAVTPDDGTMIFAQMNKGRSSKYFSSLVQYRSNYLFLAPWPRMQLCGR